MKHFYTNLLAAAWMMDEFDMQFCRKDGVKLQGDSGVLLSVAWDRYYVHPDSIHLLTPQRGDLVLASYYHKTNYVYRLVTNVFKDGFEVGGFSRYGFGEAIDGREIHKIIQRNGVAFIAPESGE